MIKKLEVNGGVRRKNNGGIVLTIYSVPFARYLLKSGIKTLNLECHSACFLATFGGQNKISFERVKQDNPLCVIRITKLLPKPFKNEIKNSKKQKRVKVVIAGLVTKKELIGHNKAIAYKEAENIGKAIPENEKIIVGCHVSCFRNKSGFNYRLNIRHRILEEVALKKEKVLVCRDENGNFVIKKNIDGNSFSFYKNPNGYPLAYMQISPSLIKEKENNLFKSGRRCFSSRAFLSSKEFQLDISKFFINKEERQLAYALLNRNTAVRIPEIRKREADIILKDCRIQIELTTISPSIESNKNSPHSGGMHINGRICEGFLIVYLFNFRNIY